MNTFRYRKRAIKKKKKKKPGTEIRRAIFLNSSLFNSKIKLNLNCKKKETKLKSLSSLYERGSKNYAPFLSVIFRKKKKKTFSDESSENSLLANENTKSGCVRKVTARRRRRWWENPFIHGGPKVDCTQLPTFKVQNQNQPPPLGKGEKGGREGGG